jgi:hypothetical protein
MDCADVKEARIRGEALDAAMHEHVASCPWCSAGERAVAGPGIDDAVFASLERSIAAEQGVGAWLKSRSTEMRLSLAAAVALGVSLLFFAIAPRSKYGPVAIERVLLTVSVFAVLVLAVARVVLRPFQAPEATRRALWLAGIGALAVPVLFALLPAGESFAHLPHHVAFGTCFFGGLATGAVFVAALHLLHREHRAARSTALLAAAAGGLAGNLALELHCPITTSEHLLASHASVGFALVLGIWLVRRGR